MITVFFSLCRVIVFMHFAHELEEKLSSMYNYNVIQTELQEPKLFGIIKKTQTTCSVSTVWNDTWLSTKQYGSDIIEKSFPFTLQNKSWIVFHSSFANFVPQNIEKTFSPNQSQNRIYSSCISSSLSMLKLPLLTGLKTVETLLIFSIRGHKHEGLEQLVYKVGLKFRWSVKMTPYSII